MVKRYKKIDTGLLAEAADIAATVEALGLPVEARNSRYGVQYQVLNVFRDDKNLGSCYFSKREEDGPYLLTDWADRQSVDISFVRKDGTEKSRPADIIDYVRKARGCSFMEACSFIAEASGFTLDGVEKEVSADEEADEARRKAALRACREKNRCIAVLLGLEHTEKVRTPQGREEIRTAAATQKAEYQHYPCWLDKIYIGAIEDGYDYHISLKDGSGRDHEGWVPAEKLAHAAARRLGAKVMKIDRIEAESSMLDYCDLLYGAKHRAFFKMLDETPDRVPAEFRDGVGYVYIIYREPWKPTLTELQAEDPEMYEYIIAGKKQEALADVEEKIKRVEKTVFDRTEYDTLMSDLQHRKEEILSI